MASDDWLCVGGETGTVTDEPACLALGGHILLYCLLGGGREVIVGRLLNAFLTLLLVGVQRAMEFLNSTENKEPERCCFLMCSS